MQDIMWDTLYGNMPEGQLLQFMLLRPTGEIKFVYSRLLENSLAKAADYLKRQNAVGYNIHFRVATMTHQAPAGLGGGAEMSSYLPCVWMDVDGLSGAALDERIKIVMKWLEPSLVIKTGGGAHFYWCFTEPVQLNSINQVHWKNALLGITKLLNGDPAPANVAAKLRVPGYINTKPSRNGYVANIVYRSSVKYSSSVFNFYVYAETPKQPKQWNAPVKKRTLSWAYQQWINHGIPVGQRNMTLFKIAMGLATFYGWEWSDIESAVHQAAAISGTPRHEADKILESASKRCGRK